MKKSFGSELNQYPSQPDFYRISTAEVKIAAKSVATALNKAGGQPAKYY